MSIELRWIGSVSASALHAASAIAAGQTLVDPQLAAALEEPAQALLTATSVAGVRKFQLLTQLTALAGGIENNSQLAEVALVKTLGRNQTSAAATQQVAHALASLENALLKARPGLVDELLLRGEPLRQQWEARGPGLWRLVSQRTDASLCVESADVLLVLPALGGGGAAHWQYNSVRIEAMLANPLYQLPEVLRLAWLLAQLQLDLPMYTELVSPAKWQQAVPLVMIPAILTAAEEVELAYYDLPTLTMAVEHWTRVSTSSATKLATALDAWWQTYQNARPRFPVALAALSEMLP